MWDSSGTTFQAYGVSAGDTLNVGELEVREEDGFVSRETTGAALSPPGRHVAFCSGSYMTVQGEMAGGSALMLVDRTQPGKRFGPFLVESHRMPSTPAWHPTTDVLAVTRGEQLCLDAGDR